ncbi:HEAT repeat domain-containing protein [Emticicia sp. BO119]|uniref:HEAT repeat domain-containing protein n=1 Tax=Emticicia sp. BO119 TaxID=2757768 RepID=UPI0015F050AE|nr:HEAT repeat domain-containing protein [Emticicia sp. BO119]MBA4849824.1 HEAT repeat domain-containing protein [Emticicia sp. BO119]
MEQLFADYLEDKLNTRQKQELETLLANDEALRDEFEDLKAFYADMHKPTELDPTATLDLGFYMMLEKEKGAEQKKKEKEQKGAMRVSWVNSPILKYAAGIIILLGIFWVGRKTADKDLNDISDIPSLREEMKETRQMLSMLKNESASERIQAVNYSYDISKPDDKVLEALIKTLNTDTNINVRTAAAEALSHFGSEKIARDALIQTLLTQKEPTLQITVIDILAGLGDKRAVKPMQKLLQSTDTEDFVKRKAMESVKVLSL